MDPVTWRQILPQSHCSLGLKLNKSSDIKFVEAFGLNNVVQKRRLLWLRKIYLTKTFYWLKVFKNCIKTQKVRFGLQDLLLSRHPLSILASTSLSTESDFELFPTPLDCKGPIFLSLTNYFSEV